MNFKTVFILHSGRFIIDANVIVLNSLASLITSREDGKGVLAIDMQSELILV